MNMKIVLIVILSIVSTTFSYSQTLQDGDMIFHTSKSSQSQMLQIITKSKLTHCGIIFHRNGRPYVFEAVEPVKITPLNEWINRGVGKKYTVTRVKGGINKNRLKSMYDYAKNQLGKGYDIKFQWSDSKMYCSELIYKVYASGNYTLSKPKTFSQYDLSSSVAKDAIKKRYGNSFNKNELVISPVDLYKSPLVRVVYSNY
jgi:hypothetical protein